MLCLTCDCSGIDYSFLTAVATAHLKNGRNFPAAIPKKNSSESVNVLDEVVLLKVNLSAVWFSFVFASTCQSLTLGNENKTWLFFKTDCLSNSYFQCLKLMFQSFVLDIVNKPRRLYRWLVADGLARNSVILSQFNIAFTKCSPQISIFSGGTRELRGHAKIS